MDLMFTPTPLKFSQRMVSQLNEAQLSQAHSVHCTAERLALQHRWHTSKSSSENTEGSSTGIRNSKSKRSEQEELSQPQEGSSIFQVATEIAKEMPVLKPK